MAPICKGPLGTAELSLPKLELERGGGKAGSGLPAHLAGLPAFPLLAKKLGLLPGDDDARPNLREPSAPSYVFNGALAPALPALVEAILARGFRSEELGKIFACPVTSKDSRPFFPAAQAPDPRVQKTVLVYVLGGVCRAELAAIRFLAARKGHRVLVAATHILQKDALLKSLLAWPAV